jgi:hypothetical protein
MLLASTAWIAFCAPASSAPSVAISGGTAMGHDSPLRLLKRVDTVTTTYTYDQTGNVTGKSTTVSSPPPPPPNCFPAGSMVEMTDGRMLPIEQVRVGDFVRGRHGETNEVLALAGTWLGGRPLYLLNGEHRTTGEHLHWGPQGPAAIDPIESDLSASHLHRVLTCGGTIEIWRKPSLARSVQRLGVGSRAAHRAGSKYIETVEVCERTAPETPLYDLVLAGSHTMWVDGYLVGGWAHEADFDYDTWLPKAMQCERQSRRIAA